MLLETCQVRDLMEKITDKYVLRDKYGVPKQLHGVKSPLCGPDCSVGDKAVFKCRKEMPSFGYIMSQCTSSGWGKPNRKCTGNTDN